jgi:hypothetical protein
LKYQQLGGQPTQNKTKAAQDLSGEEVESQELLETSLLSVSLTVIKKCLNDLNNT